MRRLNGRYETDNYVELKNLRRMRIFIAVLYGLQIYMTSLTFAEFDGKTITAFQMVIMMFRSPSVEFFLWCLMFSVFVIFPGVCFFYYCLDKKSNIKSILSVACCFVCSFIILFGLGNTAQYGALYTVILDVFILFFTVILMLGTAAYNKELKEKK